MPGSRAILTALVGTAVASDLATIKPCTQKPGLYSDEVVTAQFQEVSYCVPSQTVQYSTLTSSGYGPSKITVTSTITTTVYPLASTSVYVSTVIPCAYDGSKARSSCTVTTTDQNVDCRETSSTITSYKPYQTTTVYPITPSSIKYGYGNQTYHNVTSYTTKTTTSTETHYTTVSKHYDASFNQIGGWVIPGYSGASINKGDKEDANGSKYQSFNVTDCKKVDNGTYTCSQYAEVWTSKKAPSSTSLYSTALSSHATAPTAGTYSYTFTQTAPAATYTAPPHGSTPSSVITAPAQTWEYTVTKSCTGPTTWDITSTISKTITYTCPFEHSTPGGQHPTTYTSHGGSYPTGSNPTGAYPTGGHPTGGYPTGGHPTGGYPTGGNPTGGYPTGGNPTGGYPTGAYPTGGNPTGGNPTGGNPTGGYPTGGYPTGGNPTGGNPTGGNPTGGNPTGGYPTGGYPTGGNPTGGNPTTGSGTYPTGSCKGEFKLAIIDTGARFQKSNFVGFDGDDATVKDSASGAVFNFEGSDLKTGSEYVSTSGSSQYSPFEKTSSQPGSAKYTVDSSGNLQLSGAKGFCQKGDTIFVVYGFAPYGCSTVNLQKKDIPQTGCTTTTYATSTTSSSSLSTYTTATTSTPDISADPIYEPTPLPTATGTRYTKKRFVIRAQ